MKCISPIRIKNPAYPECSSIRFIDCACGKCYNCLVNRRRSWFFRLSAEALYSNGTSFFVSLDYAPEYCDMSLHVGHLQKFFKCLRHHVSFKYYAIGEFGTSPKGTHRPHYHCIMFFDTPCSLEYVDMLCCECWHYGRVDVGYVEPASINYVLHYHIRPKKPFCDNRKTFCIMSKGLGLKILDQNLHSFLNLIQNSLSRRVTNQYGDSFVLPRYYVKKFIEYGFPVKEIDGSTIDYSKSNTRTLVDGIVKGIKYDANGIPTDEFIDLFNSIADDLLRDSDRKLSKYNHQEKF